MTEEPEQSSLPSAPMPTPHEVADLAIEHLRTFIRLATLDAEVRIGSVADDEVIMDMSGTDAAILIGRHGQTLDALQYLLLVMVSSRRPLPAQFRLTVDVEGYRQRRTEALRRYALSLAAQVKATGEEAVLEPLNPLERRIVHTALMDDTDVVTYSEGQGAERHIVIGPNRDGDSRRGVSPLPGNGFFMTGPRLLVFVLALVGIIAPFAVAHALLDLFYVPAVRGIPPPLTAAIPAYGAALLIAALVLYLSAQWLMKDVEPTDKIDGLDEKEDLPY